MTPPPPPPPRACADVASAVTERAHVLLSGAALGGTTGSWRPRRPQTGVPGGLVWAEPARRLLLSGEKPVSNSTWLGARLC